MNVVSFRAALALVLGIAAPLMAADATDPRLAKLTYEGSGSSELAPEYGEISISFSVACQKSAADVRLAIEAVSAPVWKAISNKVKTVSETDKANWGDIGNISENEGAPIQVTYPSPDGKEKGGAFRVDSCSGEKLAVTAVRPSTFSGTQTIGVRSSDLNWLEGLARAARTTKQDKQRNTVKVNTGSISYLVTEAGKRNLVAKALEAAREEALGAKSKFANDKATLKFTNAHYLGHRAANAPMYEATIGSAIAKGQAPKVQLDVPMTYTIYAEAKDLIAKSANKAVGLKSDYEVTGQALADADYAAISASIAVACQTDKAAAIKAIAPLAGDVEKALRDFQGGVKATETDRFISHEANEANAYYPYQPVEFTLGAQNRAVATKYLNTCTNTIVDAPASGQAQDLTAYYSANRYFELRSKDFAKLVDTAQGMQSRYNTASANPADVRVQVSDATAQVTDATKRLLSIAARENAMKTVLDPKGLLAQDIAAHGLVKAHVVNVRVGSPRPSNKESALSDIGGMPKARSMAAMAAPGGAPEEMPVEVVKKDGSERPQFRVVRHYAFDVQVLSENYVPLLAPKQPIQQQFKFLN